MDVAEILKGAGAELPPEVLSKVTEAITTAGATHIESATLGLKTNNTALLEEKRVAKEAAIASKAAEDRALEEKLIVENDKAKLDKFYSDKQAEQNDILTKTVADLKKANSDRDLANSRAKFGGKFLHSTDADLYLEKMVKIGDDGKATYQDLKGNVVATDSEGFDTWLGSQDSLKHVLKAPNSNGGGGNGSDGTPPTGKQEAFNALLNKKNKTQAESVELSRLANEMKQESKEI